MKESLLAAAMAILDEDKVIALVKQKIEMGEQPLEIIEELKEGMYKVGKMYEKGKYFLGDLIVSGDLFMTATEFFRTNGPLENDGSYQIVIGTVKDDIHDIGKNILIQHLLCSSFKVLDLGVDVSPETFVRAVKEYSPKILCLSGLLTLSHIPMKRTIEELIRNNLRNDIKIIIGGLVNEQVMKFAGADLWAKDSSEGVALCRNILYKEQQFLIS